MRTLWSRLLATIRGREAEQELEAEVDFHLQ
jgi:hypothetical protein